MGKYDPWDEFFSALEGDEVRFDLSDLEELSRVKLPPSAYKHPEWWSRAQYYAKWADHGWHARPQLDQGEVIFRRQAPRRGRPPRSQQPPAPAREPAEEADFILVGCVAQKRDEPSAARDLYKSPLWRKRRHYAEHSGKPWAILSAEYGLLSPDEVIAPYDRYMESQSRAYREEWSRTTADSIVASANSVGADTVELHAGAAYLDHGLVRHIEAAGLSVSRPLKGLKIGEQLAWYGRSAEPTPDETGLHHEPAAVAISADHVRRIAADYVSGELGESWGELPETRSFRLPDGSPVAARLWLTFLCAVDRARDAEALWAAGLEAWSDEPGSLIRLNSRNNHSGDLPKYFGAIG